MQRSELQAIGLSRDQLRGCDAWIGVEYGTLCIVGTGRCLYDDLERWGGLPDAQVMALNYAIMLFPRLDFAFTHEHQFLRHWLALRRSQGRPSLHATKRCPGVNDVTIWPWQGSGTSALGACLTGIAMGFEKIVLAGCPMDGSGHFYDHPSAVDVGVPDKTVWGDLTRSVPRRGKETIRFWDYHNEHIFKGRVKSLSGRTREVLGAP